jgi:hypothetical protein
VHANIERMLAAPPSPRQAVSFSSPGMVVAPPSACQGSDLAAENGKGAPGSILGTVGSTSAPRSIGCRDGLSDDTGRPPVVRKADRGMPPKPARQ